MTEAVIRARGLRKSFGSFVAVDAVDFEVGPGECFGFLGPNGAGKTTTMKMIYGASPRGGGELSVIGLDVRERPRDVKRGLGVVPQDDNLDQELTVRENLVVYARYYDLPRDVRDARIGELLGFFELADRADSRVGELSGGQRRRVLIARGLIHAPRLLILDEPTTALDPQARHRVWEKLRTLKAQGTTLALTTHSMDEAEQLCDRLVIMDHGKIIAHGAPRALIAEHVPPEVFEIIGALEVRERALAAVRELAERHEQLATSLVLQTRRGDELAARLPSPLGADLVRRRATLEDVFLKLTGRSLDQ
jgi:lipooligosaccharide transport system ATP-binding protein